MENWYKFAIKKLNFKRICKTMFGIGTQEVIIIALVVLLLFGGKKIPELMHGIGKGVKGFKDGMRGIEAEITPDTKTDDKNMQ